jgi:hypothetical protein
MITHFLSAASALSLAISKFIRFASSSVALSRLRFFEPMKEKATCKFKQCQQTKQ